MLHTHTLLGMLGTWRSECVTLSYWIQNLPSNSGKQKQLYPGLDTEAHPINMLLTRVITKFPTFKIISQKKQFLKILKFEIGRIKQVLPVTTLRVKKYPVRGKRTLTPYKNNIPCTICTILQHFENYCYCKYLVSVYIHPNIYIHPNTEVSVRSCECK